MKTKFKILIVVLSLIVAAIGIFALIFVNSPEYMFLCLYIDAKNDGFDALEGYLTQNGAKKLEYITKIYDSGLFDLLKVLIGVDGEFDDTLFSFSGAKWKLKGITKSGNAATAHLSVKMDENKNYSFELYLVREDKTWRIDGFGKITPISE